MGMVDGHRTGVAANVWGICHGRAIIDTSMERDAPIMKALRVNGDRLWSRLMQMAEIGATPHGGCNRQALTDADMAGRKLLSRWAEEAGCRVRVDAVGNLFIRRAGREDTLAEVLTGWLLDST